ncbi:MAG TPA: L-2-hydroxyglutarate oxidase [Steroidobacteraceae bacterium]|nr:L-2-hydroxyglutarate oxidase [Steroidobacteraceae bacterium]
MPQLYDFAIIGGGIVGLATAHALLRSHPHATLVVLEKESGWARHQSGHNSGVIHSGIYYKPGSLKARFCQAGNRSMREFCREHGVAHEICGKVIVATREDELPQLARLEQRGAANGLQVRRIGPAELREIEPHVQGIAALQVPDAGIADYVGVCSTLARLLGEAQCGLYLGHEVTGIVTHAQGVELFACGRQFAARQLINCAGLHSDRVAALGRCDPGVQILPFRGEYYELRPERRHLVRHLVYPVPDPEFPFLGVHFTRMIGGQVEAGPNAVLAWAREGYRRGSVDWTDAREILRFAGFRKLAARYWRNGLEEMWRSVSKRAFLRSLQRLIPEVRLRDLVPAASGIRAQALRPDGTLVEDFHIIREDRCLHVCNAPSPAATASLEIGRYIAASALPGSDP